MTQENLDEDLCRIREAAREYYARKKGTWKPKRDLDAERLEDEARFRREVIFGGSLYGTMRMMRYSSGPERMVSDRPRVDYESAERVRSAFASIDFSSVEERIRKLMETKRALIPTGPSPDMVVIDELPTSSRMPELKDYQHKFLYGEWVDTTTKLGAGKNPMAEHTIRAVKKSHRKRRFSQKSK